MSILIPHYFLIIEKEDLENLESDIWDDTPVPAQLVSESTNYEINTAFRGSYTREFRKKSFWIEFIHPRRFFGAREIHLNAEYKDPSLFRNKLSLDFFKDIGILAPENHHITLTLNGEFHGVYLQLESVDDLFLTKRGLPIGPIYYAVTNSANFSLTREGKQKDSILSGYEQAIGYPSNDACLREFIIKINTLSEKDFSKEIPKHLDISKYFRWLAGAVCTMNNDGFTHNYALYRNSESGLFEIIPWDYDATWGRRINGKGMNYNYVPIGGKKDNHLSVSLLRIPEFRKLYKSILEDILETKFTVEHLENKILSLHQGIRPYVLLDPFKKKAIDAFDEEPEVIFQFIRDRNRYLKKRLVYFDL